jgi:hypothetical protein
MDLSDMISVDPFGYYKLIYSGRDQYPMPMNGNEYFIIPGSNHVFFLENKEWINGVYKSNENTFIEKITSNKALIEIINGGKILYSPEILKNKFLATDKEFRYELMPSSLPWAIKADDMNEAQLDIQFKYPINGIIILNGYVDLKKPKLFRENSRIQEMKITDKNSNKSIIVNLRDSLVYNSIKLPFTTNKLIISILKVYDGSKYSDICISAVLPMFSDEMRKESDLIMNFESDLINGEFIKTYKKIEPSMWN